MFKSLLGLAAFALASAQDINVNQYGSSPNMAVQFNGNSGSFKIFLGTGGVNSNVFFNIKYNTLLEVNSAGNAACQQGNQCTMTLGNQVTWNPISGVLNGVNYTGVVGSASATVTGMNGNFPVNVLITNTLFQQNTQVVMANNVTVDVIANTLKIAVNVTGWKAASDANSLQLQLKISSNANANLDPPVQPYQGNQKQVSLGTNGAYTAKILFETNAYLINSAGAYVSYPVTASASGNQNIVNLPINTAGDKMWWDPTVITSPNSAFTRALSLAAVVVALLAGVVTLF
jgi:hypothetical protein